jgi:hypothetical protein
MWLTSSLGKHSVPPWPQQTDLHEDGLCELGYLGDRGSQGCVARKGLACRRTPWVEHALDERAHHGSISQHDELKAVGRHERDVLAWLLEIHLFSLPKTRLSGIGRRCVAARDAGECERKRKKREKEVLVKIDR